VGRIKIVKLNLLLLGFLLAFFVAGCAGDTASQPVNKPYEPSSPPAEWLKEREAGRATAPQPGPNNASSGS
jgi:hypothetical protein